jgi:hypothetical protein
MGVTNGNSSMAAKHDELPSHFIGGNRLDQAPPSSVKDFVVEHGGHSVITSVSDIPRGRKQHRKRRKQRREEDSPP